MNKGLGYSVRMRERGKVGQRVRKRERESLCCDFQKGPTQPDGWVTIE